MVVLCCVVFYCYYTCLFVSIFLSCVFNYIFFRHIAFIALNCTENCISLHWIIFFLTPLVHYIYIYFSGYLYRVMYMLWQPCAQRSSSWNAWSRVFSCHVINGSVHGSTTLKDTYSQGYCNTLSKMTISLHCAKDSYFLII